MRYAWKSCPNRERDELRHAPSSLILALGIALGGLLSPAAAEAFTFTQITDTENPIVTDGGFSNQRYFGATWVDYDGDGDLDLFADIDTLYRNEGGGVFIRMEDTGLGSGQTITNAFGMAGNSFGDYDNDGDIDAFLVGEATYLYRNDGHHRFELIDDADIGGGTTHRGWTGAWADYDNDGNLDVAIVHPAGFVPGGPALPNMLFHSDGPPNYTFTEITTGPIVTGLDSYTVGSWSDYDNDGDMDFFIGSGPANGTLQPDNLYRNLLTETGTADFEIITDAPIGTDDQDGQLWNWIDYDNDGDLDAYVTNWGGAVGGLVNRLYRQEGDGSFTSITDQPLTTDADVSLGSIWGDFDNDGDLDCYVNSDGVNVDRVYENNGDGSFTRREDTPITAEASRRRGGSAGDYDNDGDLDLLLNGATTARALLRNDSPAASYLNIRLFGTVSNASAIGAKVRARASIDGEEVWQMREVSAQNSFNGHNSLRVHFGFGDATIVDEIIVEWPSGLTNELADVAIDQFMVIVEGTAAEIEESSGHGQLQLFESAPNPFVQSTSIGFALEQSSPVRLTIHDAAGRTVRTLVSENAAAGNHRVEWNGRDEEGHDVSSGIYLYRLEAGSDVQTQRMIRVR